ncbi:hypothetical protein GCM10011341_37490 [Frigidibacter albus]|nr:hypothetical protein GCM10011341_37490 [Frigidibacter albus]
MSVNNNTSTDMTIIDPRFLAGASITSVETAVPAGTAPPPEQEETTQNVIVGDCLVILRAMPAGSIDAVVTSPPLGRIGIHPP